MQCEQPSSKRSERRARTEEAHEPTSPLLKTINVALLLACLLTGLTIQVLIRAKAQGFLDCSFPPYDPNPVKNSWPANRHVAVKIDDAWDETGRGAFEAGVRKWNDAKTLTCSNVSFDTFTAYHFDDYAALPPDDTVFFRCVN